MSNPSSATSIAPYSLTTSDINQCSFDQWYPLFYDNAEHPMHARRKKLTLASSWMKLSDDFVRYLLDSGTLLLPSNLSRIPLHQYNKSSDVEDDEWNDNWSDEADNAAAAAPVRSSELQHEDVQQFISECLAKYDNAVFPKLNWSSPRDATYMLATSNRLRCGSATDVFLVLKSSAFVQHDLEEAYVNATDATDAQANRMAPILVLRQYFDGFQPAMEFRCFVREGELIAMCQRECNNYYEFLVQNVDKYREQLASFWRDYIRDVFPLQNYCVDLYISKKGSVWVIDFNIYGEPTAPLLFEWEELEDLAAEMLQNKSEDIEYVSQLRVVDSQQSIRPTLSMYAGLPADLTDVSNAEQISEWIRNQSQQQQAAAAGPAASSASQSQS